MDPKALDKLPLVTDDEARLAAKLGLDVRGQLKDVALARVTHTVEVAFGLADLRPPTDPMVKLAQKFGYDVSTEPFAVAGAILNCIMEQLDHESIERQALAPGDVVVHVPSGRILRVSSIGSDLRVYFKGGTYGGAVARNVFKLSPDDPQHNDVGGWRSLCFVDAAKEHG